MRTSDLIIGSVLLVFLAGVVTGGLALKCDQGHEGREGMNPNTNRFEELFQGFGCLLRPNGEPVPKHWTQFQLDELVEIKGYTFRVRYIGETSILFEPVGVPVIGQTNATKCEEVSKP